jgi:tRNA A-37 threonylcarbamoyl transferase component Bud32
MAVLSQRASRSVHLERDARGVPMVVKRFHHRGLLGALFDRTRARREAAALARLVALGLPVPKPLGVARVDGTWELRQEAIEGARALAELLGGRIEPPGGWRRLCRALGSLLARLHTLGIEHGDLHPGNVLVDARGAPWLVDLARVSVRPTEATRREADLALAAALARESLAPRVRLAFLVGYRAMSPSQTIVPCDGPALRVLEDAGRARRRALVELGLNRWLRESSRVRCVGAVLERRSWSGVELSSEDRHLVSGEAAHLRDLWLVAARLHEHRLPTVLPARLEPGSALFERPTRGAPDLGEYGRLCADRGLVPAPAPTIDARGVYYAPGAATE